MMRPLRMFALLLLSVILMLPTAEADSRVSLEGTELKATIDRAHHYHEQLDRPDSALYYFTLAASAYSPSMTRSDKEQCVKALLGKWVVLFSAYYDYPQAFETLLKAQQICRDEHLYVPRVDVSLAGMYQTLGQASGDKSLNDSSLVYYRKAVEGSHAATADLAFTNAFQLCAELERHDDLADLWAVYSRLPADTANVRRVFNRSMYQALTAAVNGKSVLGDEIIAEALAKVPERNEFRRMKVIGMLFKAEIARRNGKYDDAVNQCREIIAYSDRYGLLDAKSEVYQRLALIARETGDAAMEKEYRLRALELKDSMSYDSNHLRVDELRLLHAAREADNKIARVNADRRMRGIALGVLGVLVVVSVMFIILIIRKNRKLQEQMSALYRHTVEAVGGDTDSKASVREDETSDEKYQNSSLTGEKGRELADAIERYVATSPDIYSPDFTVGRLADAVGSNAKYVSQTINTHFGCNFNIYLNRQRVREACRRFIKDPKWEHLTIEAAGEEVGFNTRSTFINAFKRETGLTPSEYRRQSQLANNQ